MTSNKKLTKKDIQGLFWRSLPMEFSWHYERQMHMGFTFMLAKILQKLYGDDKEKLAQALQRHMEFFNCTPALSTFIGGIVASMEEKNANDEDFDTSSINTIKSALMGPLSALATRSSWAPCGFWRWASAPRWRCRAASSALLF